MTTVTQDGGNAKVVWLWLDHEKVGCGRRQYVALVGHKWVHLTLLASGEHVKISKVEFEVAQKGMGTLGPINFTKARRRLRRNAQTFGNDGTRAVKDALKSLR